MSRLPRVLFLLVATFTFAGVMISSIDVAAQDKKKKKTDDQKDKVADKKDEKVTDKKDDKTADKKEDKKDDKDKKEEKKKEDFKPDTPAKEFKYVEKDKKEERNAPSGSLPSHSATTANPWPPRIAIMRCESGTSAPKRSRRSKDRRRTPRGLPTIAACSLSAIKCSSAPASGTRRKKFAKARSASGTPSRARPANRSPGTQRKLKGSHYPRTANSSPAPVRTTPFASGTSRG